MIGPVQPVDPAPRLGYQGSGHQSGHAAEPFRLVKKAKKSVSQRLVPLSELQDGQSSSGSPLAKSLRFREKHV
jgi:hypothetical protein